MQKVMKSENIIPAVSSQVIPIPSNDSIQSDEEELVHSGYFTRSESLPNEIYVPYNNGYKKKKAPFIIGLHLQNILTKIINELLTFKKKRCGWRNCLWEDLCVQEDCRVGREPQNSDYLSRLLLQELGGERSQVCARLQL